MNDIFEMKANYGEGKQVSCVVDSNGIPNAFAAIVTIKDGKTFYQIFEELTKRADDGEREEILLGELEDIIRELRGQIEYWITTTKGVTGKISYDKLERGYREIDAISRQKIIVLCTAYNKRQKRNAPPTEPEPAAGIEVAEKKKRGRKVDPRYTEGFTRAYLEGEDLNDVVKGYVEQWIAEMQQQGFKPDASAIEDEKDRIRSGIRYQKNKQDKNADN